MAAIAVALVGAGTAGSFFLVGSGRKAVEQTEQLISAIGTVDLDAEDRILAAEESFEGLSTSQAADVSNAGALESARTAYDGDLTELAEVEELVSGAVANPVCAKVDSAYARYLSLDEAQRRRTDGIAALLTEKERCDHETEVAKREAEAAAERARQEAEEEAKANLDNLIRVDGPWWEERVSSSDGCEYFVQPRFRNLSGKTFKYVWFRISLVNAVDDVEVDIDGERYHDLRLVGPIGPGKDYRDDEYGFTLTYSCGDVEGLLIDLATVQLMDGTEYTIDWEHLRCSKSWNDTCEG